MNTLSTRFSQLGSLLQQTQDYWRPVAFHHLQLPWMEQHPALVSRLLNLTPQQVEQLATDQAALNDYLIPDIFEIRELANLSALAQFTHQSLTAVTPHFYKGMPGRKWQQINAFAACSTGSQLPVLEWCAGKSYLGFYLQHLHNINVTALEWDADLVKQAKSRAALGDVNLCSHQVDVLSPAAEPYLQTQQHVVALHACGELHERLLNLCVEKKVQQLHIAPCCYHKRRQEHYTGLSQQGKALNFSLNKAELHTAVMETVTAGATVQRQRKRLQSMRLGFDCLQRDITNSARFLDLPSLPTKWARADFKDFCVHCASLKDLTLPTTVDWQYYENLGEQRFNQVSALDLVRFIFRRPLEIWLAMDCALLLQEQGYAVQIGTFCSSHITPRNILLQAQLR